MAGHFSKKMYDNCAFQQDVNQITRPYNLVMDDTKYVRKSGVCGDPSAIPRRASDLVDIESSLMGMDKTASHCNTSKHPFCGQNGCLLTNDPRIKKHVTPFICDRGRDGDHSVITTNMKMPKHPGFATNDKNIGIHLYPNTDQQNMYQTNVQQSKYPNFPANYNDVNNSYLKPIRGQNMSHIQPNFRK